MGCQPEWRLGRRPLLCGLIPRIQHTRAQHEALLAGCHAQSKESASRQEGKSSKGATHGVAAGAPWQASVSKVPFFFTYEVGMTGMRSAFSWETSCPA